MASPYNKQKHKTKTKKRFVKRFFALQKGKSCKAFGKIVLQSENCFTELISNICSGIAKEKYNAIRIRTDTMYCVTVLQQIQDSRR